MDRISQAFTRASYEKRAAFVAYLCAGDPDFDTSLQACRAVLDAGADVLELGVPFSDPLADGLTNQLAAQRALEGGMTTERVFELVRRIREFSQVPIVFYTYYNLVFSNGVENYVQAAKAVGAKSPRILWRHVIPTALPVVVVQATLGMAGAIIGEAALSFLGLGVQPPTPSWGTMLNGGRAHLLDAPHLTVFPGLAIALLVLGFNFLGDGLRDYTDPKLKT